MTWLERMIQVHADSLWHFRMMKYADDKNVPSFLFEDVDSLAVIWYNWQRGQAMSVLPLLNSGKRSGLWEWQPMVQPGPYRVSLPLEEFPWDILSDEMRETGNRFLMPRNF